MIRIAITPETILADESAMISTIIDEGWDYVHLRHHQAGIEEIDKIIQQIPIAYHSHIRIHDHYNLLNKYNLGGAHLNSRNKTDIGYVHSRSCHSIDEVLCCQDCDYVTLSPIFNSISKIGYMASNFDYKLLESHSHPKLIALGGVTAERLANYNCFKFDGFASIGAIFSGLPKNWMEQLKKRLHSFDILDH